MTKAVWGKNVCEGVCQPAARGLSVAVFAFVASGVFAAQVPTPPQPPTDASTEGTTGATLPPGYVIGADDVLTIVFWRDKDMSGEVVVRPDGRISLPILNE